MIISTTPKIKPESMGNKRDRLLEYIKRTGPILPMQAANEIGVNSVFAGAMLSELSQTGKLKITTVKKGGSPFYYAPGDEQKLIPLSQYLNEKDKVVFENLKVKKVMFDSALTPLERVSLRQMKDYAVPIPIEDKLFWRFYLVEEQEALKSIQELSNLADKVLPKLPSSGVISVNSLGIEVKSPEPKLSDREQFLEQFKEKYDEHVKNSTTKITQELEDLKKSEKITLPKHQEKERSLEREKTIADKERELAEKERKIAEKERLLAEAEKPKEEHTTKKSGRKKKVIITPDQTSFIENPEDKIILHPTIDNKDLRDFLTQNKVQVFNKTIVSDKEIDVEAKIPLELGMMSFFIKYLNKSKISETDLSLAWSQAISKSMPLLLISHGTLAKKAENLLETRFKGTIFKKL